MRHFSLSRGFHSKGLLSGEEFRKPNPCFQGSRLAGGACCPLIVCDRGGAGSIGSIGSTGVVRRIKIGKRRGVLEYRVFSYRQPSPLGKH